MKKLSRLLILTLILGLTACGKSDTKKAVSEEKVEASAQEAEVTEAEPEEEGVVKIALSNSEILVDGEKISEDTEADVYKANDIIFYLKDQGMEYGEGTKSDEHSQIEADAHTVVHITKPGTYEISGVMEAGQIFVDLGENAKEDPEAVVTLILNNADITCTVAPAIFFYNVYECVAVSEEEEASMDVDTSLAGANLRLKDDTMNRIYGAYVAKIYKSCQLNEEGTEVVESEKLHKYDGAVYSRMSMNVFGNTGSLEIDAVNEGLCTEMHLTIYGGNISIQSGNDGINTNEDGESVFAMNGGTLNITVTGETGEGDGIDSNGWLVINGGTVNAYACALSQDSGLDSDQGIYINGGMVTATGNMIDEISDGEQPFTVFMCRETQTGGELYEIKDEEENVIMEVTPANNFTVLVVSGEGITADGSYRLWLDKSQIAEGMRGDMRPDGNMPEGMEPPEGFGEERPEPPKEGKMLEDKEPPEGAEEMKRPGGQKPPEKPDNAG